MAIIVLMIEMSHKLTPQRLAEAEDFVEFSVIRKAHSAGAGMHLK